MDTNQSYVSLFSSAGLGCFGFKQAGFECVATAELLPRRLEVQKANSVATAADAYILGDLSQELIREELFAQVNNWTKKKKQELTAVIATPPCQGMSVANHKKGNELARNSLVVHSLEIIQSLKPKFFVLENVRAFLTSACLDSDGETRTIKDAIERHLAGEYSIKSDVINLKDFGSPSSRTRTLVIGVRRDLHDVTPNSIWPARVPAPTLENLISDLPRLATMGQISKDDIYHGFRSYDPRMRPWIKDLNPGESAFQNAPAKLRPHRIIDGRIVENKSSNGDKYRRALWGKVAPCVHTRNDILASQSTVHPEDDRVFSIRELSRMMGVPDDFQWANFPLEELNELPLDSKREFLRTHEINIRQCLGEGVPTPVFKSIASNIRDCRPTMLKAGRPPKLDPESKSTPNTAEYLRYTQPTSEQAKKHAAYYTRQDTVFNLLSSVGPPKPKRPLRILEPSVGAGAFLPELFAKFDKNPVTLDLVDIDDDALDQTKQLLDLVGVPDNFTINYFKQDFLTEFTRSGYDYVIGNPPFGLTGPSNPKVDSSFGIREIYGKFLEKSMRIAKQVSFVIPKSFLSSREMHSIRGHIADQLAITAIDDYGEDAFHTINIETIGLSISSAAVPSTTQITSTPLKMRKRVNQHYITTSTFPSWVIYRNSFFDEVVKKLHLGTHTPYRDRKITKSHTGPTGDVAIIRARNIKNGAIETNNVPIEYGDNSLVPSSFKSMVAGKKALVVPNLSYYPRASVLPEGSYVDGSAAVLVPIEHTRASTNIEFFSSQDFFYFYRIARNYSTRSLNVDSISSFFWGTPKESYTPLLPSEDFAPTSALLFKVPQWDDARDRWVVK
ncbi:DNA cytosine methyltransferase [Brevibacterium sp. VCM10]|uniref:DNA cytosine methyltransferase n=1 Tax=Brevibacterium sp. VCM10 TaxID=1381751 RepID=UPI0004BB611C|nr:DNA cytosine methyltransferase [Brevibacterium sp. VCM10]